MKPLTPEDLKAFEFAPIGVIHTPFSQKFGVPRQPGLVSEATGTIQLLKRDDLKRSIAEIDQFSHLWVVFVFHDQGSKTWRPTIRPPRLGGNVKVGSLASRSPHRPNPIGISALAIKRVDLEADVGPLIEVEGVDLIDGTPILDIKPYLPFCDSIPDADAGWARAEIPRYLITWSENAKAERLAIEPPPSKESLRLIESFLEQDPRPSFQKRNRPVEAKSSEGKQYGFALEGFELKYQIQGGGFLIVSISRSPHARQNP